MPEALWAEPAEDAEDAPARARLAAAREINRTRGSYLEDLDKLRGVLAGGGTFPEMRAAVNAFQVIDNVIGELEKAAKRANASGSPDQEVDDRG